MSMSISGHLKRPRLESPVNVKQEAVDVDINPMVKRECLDLDDAAGRQIVDYSDIQDVKVKIWYSTYIQYILLCIYLYLQTEIEIDTTMTTVKENLELINDRTPYDLSSVAVKQEPLVECATTKVFLIFILSWW